MFDFLTGALIAAGVIAVLIAMAIINKISSQKRGKALEEMSRQAKLEEYKNHRQIEQYIHITKPSLESLEDVRKSAQTTADFLRLPKEIVYRHMLEHYYSK